MSLNFYLLSSDKLCDFFFYSYHFFPLLHFYFFKQELLKCVDLMYEVNFVSFDTQCKKL